MINKFIFFCHRIRVCCFFCQRVQNWDLLDQSDCRYFFRSKTDVLINKAQCYTGRTCQYFEMVEPSEHQRTISTKLSHREHKKSSCDVIKSLSQDLFLALQMLWNYIANMPLRQWWSRYRFLLVYFLLKFTQPQKLQLELYKAEKFVLLCLLLMRLQINFTSNI